MLGPRVRLFLLAALVLLPSLMTLPRFAAASSSSVHSSPSAYAEATPRSRSEKVPLLPEEELLEDDSFTELEFLACATSPEEVRALPIAPARDCSPREPSAPALACDGLPRGPPARSV